ncbi:hypothetical protein EMIT07CA2_10282 [Brevibacillus sp. IT-7CA2]
MLKFDRVKNLSLTGEVFLLHTISPLPVHEHDKEKDDQLTKEWIQEAEKRAKPDKTN